MKIKTTTAFAAIASRRHAAKTFWVVSVNKNGALSKAHVHNCNRASTREEAERILERVEKLNPTRRFVITENN